MELPPRLDALVKTLEALDKKTDRTIEEIMRIATEMIMLIDKDHSETIEFDEYLEFRETVVKCLLKKQGYNMACDTTTELVKQ